LAAADTIQAEAPKPGIVQWPPFTLPTVAKTDGLTHRLDPTPEPLPQAMHERPSVPSTTTLTARS
jgi:hypothetical protein